MPRRFSAACWILVAVAGLRIGAGNSAHSEEPPQFDAAAIEFFERDVRPLLVKRCYECHGPEAKRLEGNLLLNSRESLLKGGDTGPAVVPGNQKASLLIDAINYGETFEMPPKGKLPAEEIVVLARWVEMGAPWPASASTVDPRQKFDLAARRKSHWAWQPVREVAPPEVNDKAWPLDPIDHFVLARLEKEGLAPSGPADARTLMRRLYFDLIGLPPTPQEIADFELRMADWERGAESGERGKGEENKSPLLASTPLLNPPSPIPQLVDKLLASPHFGERWGRHWLDLMRYAESRGHEFDADSPNAWEYRDYVIRALNADVPYDQFVVEHIAGDLLDEPRINPEQGYNESIIATGFWHLGEWVHSPVDIRQDECDRIDNQIDTFSKAFLGMTVACARCHDHKFDAISQADYYALAGFVQSSDYRLARFESLDHNRRIAEQLHELRTTHGREIARLHLAAQRPILAKLDAYLLAAREAIRFSQADVTALARERELQADVLAAWVAHLAAAKRDANDPLHLWACLAHEPSDDDARIAAVARPIVAGIANRAQVVAQALSGAKIVVDYTRGDTAPFMADGSAFGIRPTQTGDVLLASDPAAPLAGFAAYGSARRDLALTGLVLAQGSQHEVGNQGGWQRPEQSLRTPTFTIDEGSVHYLVRGAGRAFAVVDSHRMLQGPLHGEVLLEWGDDAQGWLRWVTHRLQRQKGHRAHIEFTPNGSGELEILLVAQAPQAPPLPIDESAASLLAKVFGGENVRSLQDFAVAYRTLLDDAASIAARSFPDAADRQQQAALANWMAQHPVLFMGTTATTSDAGRQFIAAGKVFAEAEAKLAAQIKKQSRAAPAMWDGNAENELLLIRGKPSSPQGEVPRRFLSALGGNGPEPAVRSSGRLELAREVVAPTNPLTARVMANRVWHHLLGQGIVPSTDNLGVLGEAPTHPELLDHLAARFVREGWSVKRLIRAIVLSRTYQMSSRLREDAQQIDPANKLLHRMNVRRLEGEIVRDSLLAVSGRLDRTLYGPPVPVHLTEFMTGRGRPRGGPIDGAGRRSIYVSVRRNFLSPLMLAFDVPQPSATVGRRTVSNVPAQALILMNDPLVQQQARLWARRVLDDTSLSPQQRVALLYETAYARLPTAEESAAALAFVGEQAERLGIKENQRANSLDAWSDLCHVLLNVKEFIFVN